MKYIALFTSLLLFGIIGIVLLLPASETQEMGKWKVLHESAFIHGSRILQIMFFDMENGIAVSPGGIAKTDDGGKQWANVHSVEGNGYYSFAFADNRRGIAVGSVKNEVPLVLRTIDAGNSWQMLNFDPKVLNRDEIKITTFLDVCFDSTGTIWIVGNKGMVSASVEEDKLNILSVNSSTGELSSIACAAKGQIFTVEGNTVLTNSGNGWQKKQIDPKYYFGKVKSIGNVIWLLGGKQAEVDSEHGSGIVLRSSNSGDTWEDKTPKSGNLQFDISRDDGVLWLVGAAGQIHFSKDNGDTWLASPSPTKADLLSVYFHDSQNGWITGDRGTVLMYSH